MTVSTLRPNSTTSNTGTLTGGATAHAVLLDNSDSTRIDYNAAGEASVLGLDNFTLPAGAVVKSVSVRLRVMLASATPGTLTAKLTVGSKTATASRTLSEYRSPGTYTFASIIQTGITDPDVDAATLTITKGAGGHILVY